MKNLLLLAALSAALLLQSCSSSQLGGVVTGSSLGGMFGSAIGGIIGGPRGSDIGTVIGMAGGAAAGAAVTAPRSQQQSSTSAADDTYQYSDSNAYSDDVSYGRAEAYAPTSQWEYLEVKNVQFNDENNNRRLDAGERAFIVLEIYNRSDATIHNIAPQITCDNKRVVVSPTAIFSQLPSGRGFRYKAEIHAPSRLRTDRVTFTVAFGQKKQLVKAKTFAIQTGQ